MNHDLFYAGVVSDKQVKWTYSRPIADNGFLAFFHMSSVTRKPFFSMCLVMSKRTLEGVQLPCRIYCRTGRLIVWPVSYVVRVFARSVIGPGFESPSGHMLFLHMCHLHTPPPLTRPELEPRTLSECGCMFTTELSGHTVGMWHRVWSWAFQVRFEFMDQYKTENILIKLGYIYIGQKQTKNCSWIAKNIDCYR